ncbi:glycosyltransferase family 4 protein [Candidatus Binatus sp.]|uniref:glycosyltransferase family 4 protein n=1 Tax=Candidatus Binatus sp. TaxID=2811406 RepID=UPI003BAF2BD4
MNTECKFSLNNWMTLYMNLNTIETNNSTLDPIEHNSTALEGLSFILVSPNVSEQMGGEAIKALQISLELTLRGARVHQVTHERVKAELDRNFPQMCVSYVKDTWTQKIAYRAGLLNPLLSAIISAPLISIIFQRRAVRLVQALLRDCPESIVHFTAPVSPVLPYLRIPSRPRATVVIGPINGNIHYPPALRDRESIGYRLQRRLHPLLQLVNRAMFSGKRDADVLLVAGGERTRRSLLMAGCREEQFVDSIDSGVLDRLCETPRLMHPGRNLSFVHNGRLVSHKGTDLIIKSLRRTRNPVELDIIGRGPELDKLKALSQELSLQNRVRFIEWIADHRDLATTLRRYRAFVFPSLAEANGIVVQEAMVMGLPVIALNWGGPSLLVTAETGILIDPVSEEYIIDKLAHAMDTLAEDGNLAERMSAAGRQRALEKGFLWSSVVKEWTKHYRQLVKPHFENR